MASETIVTKSVMLGPGDSVILPIGATITSVTIDGVIDVTSSCDNLPPSTPYACWVFTWERSSSGALQDAFFKTLTIGDQVYAVPDGFNAYNNGTIGNPTNLFDWIDGSPATFQGMVKAGCSTETGGGTYILKIKIPAGITLAELKIENPDADGSSFMYIRAIPDSDCTSC